MNQTVWREGGLCFSIFSHTHTYEHIHTFLFVLEKNKGSRIAQAQAHSLIGEAKSQKNHEPRKPIKRVEGKKKTMKGKFPGDNEA